MFDRLSVRKLLLCVVSAGIAAYAIASAVSTRAESRNVPVLSGTYVFNATQNCLPVANDLQNITGTMTFDPKTGKMNLFEYITSGNPLTKSPARFLAPVVSEASGDTTSGVQ